MSADASTPLMRQYHGIKQQVPNALLLFRLGDFYELFFDDAVTAARELEITLTSRNKEKGQAIPMCGVPYHAAENYIAKLIQKGYRVAICDQTEQPTKATKLVRREVTRIVTPGTTMNASVLSPHENRYLAAVMANAGRAGLAHVDVSTGEFRATELDTTEIGPALETLDAREALIPTGTAMTLACLKTDVESWVFGADYATRSLCDHFRLLALDGCGLEGRSLATGAAAAILHYLKDTQRNTLEHLERPTFYDRANGLVLDATTVRNLELVEPLFQGESREATLMHVLDHTRTGMGGRLLRRRLLAPSIDPGEINERLGRCRGIPGSADSASGSGQRSRVDSGPGAIAGAGIARLGGAARIVLAGEVPGGDSIAEGAFEEQLVRAPKGSAGEAGRGGGSPEIQCWRRWPRSFPSIYRMEE